MADRRGEKNKEPKVFDEARQAIWRVPVRTSGRGVAWRITTYR
jgi:hypothetical protein